MQIGVSEFQVFLLFLLFTRARICFVCSLLNDNNDNDLDSYILLLSLFELIIRYKPISL
jgi:hypothetical protein